MYAWQKLDVSERRKVLKEWMHKGQPAHDLPHFTDGIAGIFFLTGANYQHQPVLGSSNERMGTFTENLLSEVIRADFVLEAFCVLPNHYHLLVEGNDIAALRLTLGKLHGRTSRQWNLEDKCTGRKVWFRVFDRIIRSNRQYYSVLNYIHENPVHHGYSLNKNDWPWSSALEFTNQLGIKQAQEILLTYPSADSGIKEPSETKESGLQARLWRDRP
ncbi:MAG: transposase [Puniceicoccaceae bacterium]